MLKSIEVNILNISVQQLLRKIEEELHEAKGNTNEARIRERIHAIKSLCELILDDQAMPAASKNMFVPQQTAHQVQPASIQQPKRLEMEDNANGDSLFDF
jgi:Family of unknown function (DUF5327)